jgi:hypothetical protein
MLKKSLAATFRPAPLRFRHPQKLSNKFKVLQRAKRLSSIRILAPAHVIGVEVFGRSWKSVISSGGVAIEVGRLRARALVTP